MRMSFAAGKERGFSLVELLVVMVVIGFLTVMMMDSFSSHSHGRDRALRIQCVMNLKQTGLAYRIWAGDHNDKFPAQVPEKSGGAMEFTSGLNAFRSFQVMSNELSIPKTLFCPAESDEDRFAATNFNLSNSNLSYFVGVDAIETNATMILSGDHNITNGTAIHNGLLGLTTNALAGWTSEVHNKLGNIGLADGSVQQVSIMGLRDQIAGTGFATNRVQMPVLGP